MELEHEAELGQPRVGQAVLAERAGVLTVEHQAAAARAVQQPQQVKQRALARARGADDGNELAARNRQADVGDQGHRQLAGQGARQRLGHQQRRRLGAHRLGAGHAD
jgi:hypothetical protein